LSLFNDFFRKMHDRVTARFYPGSRLILGLENTQHAGIGANGVILA
jgi:hypothetical protein